MIEQLSIYTENKKGAVKNMLSALTAAGLNVLGFVSTDSGEFGTIRFILSDTEKGMGILTEKGYVCKKGEIMAVELCDEPGSLEKMLTVIDNMNIGIDYIYVGYLRENSTPVIMVHTGDMEIVSAKLIKEGYNVH